MKNRQFYSLLIFFLGICSLMFFLFSCDIKKNNTDKQQLILKSKVQKEPYTKTEELDTLKTIKEYSADDKLLSITIKKPINACWKPISYQAFDENGNKTSEWQKQYSVAKGSTCDFTSYVIHYRYYINQKLVKESFEHSACDDCETYPCGTKTEWDSSGKIKFQKVYENCNINFIPNRPKTVSIQN